MMEGLGLPCHSHGLPQQAIYSLPSRRSSAYGRGAAPQAFRAIAELPPRFPRTLIPMPFVEIPTIGFVLLRGHLRFSVLQGKPILSSAYRHHYAPTLDDGAPSPCLCSCLISLHILPCMDWSIINYRRNALDVLGFNQAFQSMPAFSAPAD